MPELSRPPSTYVYRGVHADHPARASALNGVVVPGDVHGTITPEQHNLRDTSGTSPFTSWTHNRNVAIGFAKSRGRGGLLLVLPTGAPSAGDTWSWEASPDAWLEDEVLLRGVRIGAEVIRL